MEDKLSSFRGLRRLTSRFSYLEMEDHREPRDSTDSDMNNGRTPEEGNNDEKRRESVHSHWPQATQYRGPDQERASSASVCGGPKVLPGQSVTVQTLADLTKYSCYSDGSFQSKSSTENSTVDYMERRPDKRMNKNIFAEDARQQVSQKGQDLEAGSSSNWLSVIKEALEMSNGMELGQDLSEDVASPMAVLNTEQSRPSNEETPAESIKDLSQPNTGNDCTRTHEGKGVGKTSVIVSSNLIQTSCFKRSQSELHQKRTDLDTDTFPEERVGNVKESGRSCRTGVDPSTSLTFCGSPEVCVPSPECPRTAREAIVIDAFNRRCIPDRVFPIPSFIKSESKSLEDCGSKVSLPQSLNVLPLKKQFKAETTVRPHVSPAEQYVDNTNKGIPQDDAFCRKDDNPRETLALVEAKEAVLQSCKPDLKSDLLDVFTQKEHLGRVTRDFCSSSGLNVNPENIDSNVADVSNLNTCQTDQSTGALLKMEPFERTYKMCVLRKQQTQITGFSHKKKTKTEEQESESAEESSVTQSSEIWPLNCSVQKERKNLTRPGVSNILTEQDSTSSSTSESSVSALKDKLISPTPTTEITDPVPPDVVTPTLIAVPQVTSECESPKHCPPRRGRPPKTKRKLQVGKAEPQILQEMPTVDQNAIQEPMRKEEVISDLGSPAQLVKEKCKHCPPRRGRPPKTKQKLQVVKVEPQILQEMPTIDRNAVQEPMLKEDVISDLGSPAQLVREKQSLKRNTTEKRSQSKQHVYSHNTVSPYDDVASSQALSPFSDSEAGAIVSEEGLPTKAIRHCKSVKRSKSIGPEKEAKILSSSEMKTDNEFQEENEELNEEAGLFTHGSISAKLSTTFTSESTVSQTQDRVIQFRKQGRCPKTTSTKSKNKTKDSSVQELTLTHDATFNPDKDHSKPLTTLEKQVMPREMKTQQCDENGQFSSHPTGSLGPNDKSPSAMAQTKESKAKKHSDLKNLSTKEFSHVKEISFTHSHRIPEVTQDGMAIPDVVHSNVNTPEITEKKKKKPRRWKVVDSVEENGQLAENCESPCKTLDIYRAQAEQVNVKPDQISQTESESSISPLQEEFLSPASQSEVGSSPSIIQETPRDKIGSRKTRRSDLSEVKMSNGFEPQPAPLELVPTEDADSFTEVHLSRIISQSTLKKQKKKKVVETNKVKSELLNNNVLTSSKLTSPLENFPSAHLQYEAEDGPSSPAQNAEEKRQSRNISHKDSKNIKITGSVVEVGISVSEIGVSNDQNPQTTSEKIEKSSRRKGNRRNNGSERDFITEPPNALALSQGRFHHPDSHLDLGEVATDIVEAHECGMVREVSKKKSKHVKLVEQNISRTGSPQVSFRGHSGDGLCEVKSEEQETSIAVTSADVSSLSMPKKQRCTINKGNEKNNYLTDKKSEAIVSQQGRTCEFEHFVPQKEELLREKQKEIVTVKQETMMPTPARHKHPSQGEDIKVLKTLGDVSQIKRRIGRPCKKKTLLKMAKLFAASQEVRTNAQENGINQGLQKMNQNNITSVPRGLVKSEKPSAEEHISPLRKSSRICKINSCSENERLPDHTLLTASLNSSDLSKCPVKTEVTETSRSSAASTSTLTVSSDTNVTGGGGGVQQSRKRGRPPKKKRKLAPTDSVDSGQVREVTETSRSSAASTPTLTVSSDSKVTDGGGGVQQSRKRGRPPKKKRKLSPTDSVGSGQGSELNISTKSARNTGTIQVSPVLDALQDGTALPQEDFLLHENLDKPLAPQSNSEVSPGNYTNSSVTVSPKCVQNTQNTSSAGKTSEMKDVQGNVSDNLELREANEEKRDASGKALIPQGEITTANTRNPRSHQAAHWNQRAAPKSTSLIRQQDSPLLSQVNMEEKLRIQKLSTHSTTQEVTSITDEKPFDLQNNASLSIDSTELLVAQTVQKEVDQMKAMEEPGDVVLIPGCEETVPSTPRQKRKHKKVKQRITRVSKKRSTQATDLPQQSSIVSQSNIDTVDEECSAVTYLHRKMQILDKKPHLNGSETDCCGGKTLSDERGMSESAGSKQNFHNLKQSSTDTAGLTSNLLNPFIDTQPAGNQGLTSSTSPSDLKSKTTGEAEEIENDVSGCGCMIEEPTNSVSATDKTENHVLVKACLSQERVYEGSFLESQGPKDPATTQNERSCPGAKSTDQRKRFLKNTNARKPLLCKYCSRSFRHLSAYTIHQRIHTGEKPYRCQHCGKNFAQLAKLKCHINIHKQPVSLQCPCCLKQFHHRGDLIAHFGTHLREAKQGRMTDESGLDLPSKPESCTTDSLESPRLIRKRSFRCSVCSKYFLNKRQRIIHMRIHNEGKPFSCKDCGKKFRKSASLAVHERTHWPIKPYACSICGKGFSQLKALKLHALEHTGETPFSCSHCGLAFSDLSTLRIHQRSSLCIAKKEGDGDKAGIEGFLVQQGVDSQVNTPLFFKCQICKQLYRKWCQYTLHLQTHTTLKPYLCFACGQNYEKDSEVSSHCEVCCRSSGEENVCGVSLSQIFKTNERERKIQTCPAPLQNPTDRLQSSKNLSECQQDSQTNTDSAFCSGQPTPNNDQQSESVSVSLSSPPEITEMQTAVSQSGDVGPEHQAALTIESFSTINLDSNPPSPTPSVISCTSSNESIECIVIGPGPWRLECRHCGQRFKRRRTLQAHMQKHAPVYRYRCGYCGQAFQRRNKLWLHQRLHQRKGRFFPCSQCSLQFRFLGSYKEHLLVHAEQKPYACPLCPQTFALEESLNAHQSECHSPDTNLRCDVCAKRFSSLRNMVRHSRLHNSSTSHQCLLCKCSFTNNRVLQEHKRSHSAQLSGQLCLLPEVTSQPLSFPHQCKRCKASFSTGDLLYAHQICHFTRAKTVVSSLGATGDSCRPDSTAPSPPWMSTLDTTAISNANDSLYTYPHPDRLYVTPSQSVVRTQIIDLDSYDDEDCQENPSTSQSMANTDVSPPRGQSGQEMQRFTEASSGTGNAYLPQALSGLDIIVIADSESVECQPQRQVDRSYSNLQNKDDLNRPGLTVCSSLEKSSHVIAAATTTVCLEEDSQESFECADCGAELNSVSELHRHYLCHAVGTALQT